MRTHCSNESAHQRLRRSSKSAFLQLLKSRAKTGMSEIAIVGMACRYAEARSPRQLWENVLAQRRSFRRIPRLRLNLADYSVPQLGDDAISVTMAAVLEDYEFDRVRFRVSGDTFLSTDLAHWLALDVAEQALTD